MYDNFRYEEQWNMSGRLSRILEYLRKIIFRFSYVRVILLCSIQASSSAYTILIHIEQFICRYV